MFVDRDLAYPPHVPSVQSLYDLAQKEGLFKGVPLEIFDKLPHLLLWAAIDSESYSGFANGMLEQAQVPKTLRLFDHAAVLKLVEKMLAPKPKPP